MVAVVRYLSLKYTLHIFLASRCCNDKVTPLLLLLVFLLSLFMRIWFVDLLEIKTPKM